MRVGTLGITCTFQARAEEARENQRVALPFKESSQKSQVIVLLTSHWLELHLCDGGWEM